MNWLSIELLTLRREVVEDLPLLKFLQFPPNGVCVIQINRTDKISISKSFTKKLSTKDTNQEK